MGRAPRNAEGGLVFQALNRANARLALFEDPADHDAFLRVLAEAVARFPVRLFAFCVMPHHFLVVGAAACVSWFSGAARPVR